MFRSRLTPTLVLAALAVPLFANPAHAAMANDGPGDAIALGGGSVVTMDSTDADPGLSAGEPTPSCAGVSHTLWYGVSVDEDVRLRVSSFGSKVDTVLAVYDATLNEVACNDDDLETGSMQARVRTIANAGAYLIQVGTYGSPGATGGNLRLEVALDAYLKGDLISEAIDLTLPASSSLDLAPYTKGPEDERAGCWSWGSTAWFTVTAPVDGVLMASTLGSEADTIVGVLDGDQQLLNCVDSGAGEIVSSRVIAGESRYIVVDLYWPDPTSVVALEVTLSDPVPGDEPYEAIPLPLRTEQEGTLTGASGSPVDWGGCYGGDGRSIWYTAIADVAGDYMVDLATDAHVHVAVFTSDPSAGAWAESCDGFPWITLDAGQQVWIMVSDHFWDLADEPFLVEMQRAVVVDGVVAGAIVREDGHTYAGASALIAGAGADVDPEHGRAWACAFALLVYECVEP